MKDSTFIFPAPVEEGLIGGEMHLSSIAASVAIPEPEPSWRDSDTLSAIIVITTVILIAISKNIANIIPSLIGSLVRWKEIQNIEDSAKLKRDRNLVTIFCIVPFWLIASIYSLWEIDITSNNTTESNLLATGLVLGVYCLIRTIMESTVIQGKVKNIQNLLSGSSYTYFIIMTILLFAEVAIGNLIDLNSEEIKNLSYYVIGGIYSIFLLRKTQILKKSCNLLSAILYLCALEILPTSLLVATAIIF